MGNTGIDWDEARVEENVVFLPFSCSQTTELAGRRGAHSDLKPIPYACLAKVFTLSLHVNSANLVLAGAFCGQEDKGLLLVSELPCDSVVLSSPHWFPPLRNEEEWMRWGGVSVSFCCVTNHPEMWWLQTANIYLTRSSVGWQLGLASSG